MTEYIVARLDPLPDQRDRLVEWLLTKHIPSVANIDGLDPNPVVYQAQHVETAIRTYRSTPEYTVLYPIAPTSSARDLADSDAFIDWWAQGVTERFCWIASHDWMATRRLYGPNEPIAGDRVLLTQVHVAPGHEAGWATWYRDRHVPDANAVPGFFAGPMWQLEAFDVNSLRWHVAPKPRFTHVLPLTEHADWVAGPGSPEFLALAADTQTTWAGAIEHVVSQFGQRIA